MADGKLDSLWMATSARSAYPSLSGDRRFDVCIVGGGIAGLTTALQLAQAGRKVCVVERGRIAEGESGYTTAHLTQMLDTRYFDLERKFGRERTKLAAEAHGAAIDFIERFVTSRKVDCGFRRLPAFLYADREARAEEIEREAAACQKAGLRAELVDPQSVPLPFKVHAALRLEHQADFHPRRYFLALAEAAVAAGATIFEKTGALEMHDGAPCRVVTELGTISCGDLVVLANAAVHSRFLLTTRVAAYRTYAVAFHRKEPLPAGLYWDNEDPYHYTRTANVDGDTWVVVGGEDHKTGSESATDARYDALERYCHLRYRPTDFGYRWSGQVLEPVDGLAFIGKSPMRAHEWIGVGFSGNGMTYGTVSGLLLADLVLDRKSPWAEVFDPTRRKPLASAVAFVTENVDYPKHMVTDRLKPPEATSFAEVPAGEGRLVSHGGLRLAVYRAHDGTLTAMSAVCPHLGCHVKWNQAESSWDCPCHGSRFDAKGAVRNGPATRDLTKVKVDE